MKCDTKIIHAGRTPADFKGIVNPPVYHASTVVFPSVADFLGAKRDQKTLSYGRFGTPTTFCLTDAVAELEGGHQAVPFPSGTAAIAGTLLAFLRNGDHLLVPDTAYGPTRRFCDGVLKRLGISTTYYPPRAGAAIVEFIRHNTRVVYLESPGSLTFEVQDVPTIARIAHVHGAWVVLDNTWASPLFFQPFQHGVDVSIQAATKYVVGHSDAMIGIATANEKAWPFLQAGAHDLGQCIGPDDAYLGQRGIRTLAVRLRQHERNALQIASWLAEQPQVEEVLYPALPTSPDHALWKRDFSGASGLFGVVLKASSPASVHRMIEALHLFGLGASWGGYESLVYPANPFLTRQHGSLGSKPLVRLHIGLEDPNDLIEDLGRALPLLSAESAR